MGEGGGDIHGDVRKGGEWDEFDENERNEKGDADEHCEGSGDAAGPDTTVVARQPSSCASVLDPTFDTG